MNTAVMLDVMDANPETRKEEPSVFLSHSNIIHNSGGTITFAEDTEIVVSDGIINVLAGATVENFKDKD